MGFLSSVGKAISGVSDAIFGGSSGGGGQTSTSTTSSAPTTSNSQYTSEGDDNINFDFSNANLSNFFGKDSPSSSGGGLIGDVDLLSGNSAGSDKSFITVEKLDNDTVELAFNYGEKLIEANSDLYKLSLNTLSGSYDDMINSNKNVASSAISAANSAISNLSKIDSSDFNKTVLYLGAALVGLYVLKDL